MLIPVCERHRIAVVAYSPLGSGQFPTPGTWRGEVLRDIGVARGVSARTIALAFLARRPSTFVIPKTSRPDHVDALAAAKNVVLTPHEVATIEAAFPLGPPKSKMPAL